MTADEYEEARLRAVIERDRWAAHMEDKARKSAARTESNAATGVPISALAREREAADAAILASWEAEKKRMIELSVQHEKKAGLDRAAAGLVRLPSGRVVCWRDVLTMLPEANPAFWNVALRGQGGGDGFSLDQSDGEALISFLEEQGMFVFPQEKKA